MNTPDALNAQQRRRLADFDDGLATLLDSNADDDRVWRQFTARVHTRRRLAILLPVVWAVVIGVFIGPPLWQLVQQLFALLPGDLGAFSQDPRGLLSALQELPVYVWAFVGGIILTIGTTLAES